MPDTLDWLPYLVAWNTRSDLCCWYHSRSKWASSTGLVQLGKTKTALLPTLLLDYSQILYVYWKSPLCIGIRDDTTTFCNLHKLSVLFLLSEKSNILFPQVACNFYITWLFLIERIRSVCTNIRNTIQAFPCGLKFLRQLRTYYRISILSLTRSDTQTKLGNTHKISARVWQSQNATRAFFSLANIYALTVIIFFILEKTL